MTALPMPTTPVYELTLPVTKKKVKYRPFLVKEEKVLLIANETDSLEQANLAIRNVVESCTFNKLDLDKTPLADIEYLFIMIRAKSVGEEVQGEVKCSSCGAQNDYTINLEKIKISQPKKVDPNVRIADDTVITMKYPSMDITKNLTNIENGADLSIEIMASCVAMITVGETIYNTDSLEITDIVAYLENLSKKQLAMVSEFMDSIPVVAYKDEFTCTKCNSKNDVYMEGIGSFFV